jgi:hypothetical protein
MSEFAIVDVQSTIEENDTLVDEGSDYQYHEEDTSDSEYGASDSDSKMFGGDSKESLTSEVCLKNVFAYILITKHMPYLPGRISREC